MDADADFDADDADASLQVTVDLDEEGRIAFTQHPYTFQAWKTSLSLESLGGLRKDVEAVSCFPARNYFIHADEEPAFTLERLALAIFEAHAAVAACGYDRSLSGAEWWVQSRYAAGKGDAATEAEGDSNHSESKMFHWDKDEALYDAGVYVCPQVSTVTYLTDGGAPTVVLEKTPGVMYSNERINDVAIPRCFVSHPCAGKHIAFDGRYLHGILAELRRTLGPDRRLTFLVNVWLNHKPPESNRFPLEAAKSLGLSDSVHVELSLKHQENCAPVPVALDIDVKPLEFEWEQDGTVIPLVRLPVPRRLLHEEGVASASPGGCASVSTSFELRFEEGCEAAVTERVVVMDEALQTAKTAEVASPTASANSRRRSRSRSARRGDTTEAETLAEKSH